MVPDHHGLVQSDIQTLFAFSILFHPCNHCFKVEIPDVFYINVIPSTLNSDERGLLADPQNDVIVRKILLDGILQCTMQLISKHFITF